MTRALRLPPIETSIAAGSRTIVAAAAVDYGRAAGLPGVAVRDAGAALRAPGGHVEVGALVGRALAHIGVAVGAEHVDGAGDGLLVGTLAGHQRHARLHLIA